MTFQFDSELESQAKQGIRQSLLDLKDQLSISDLREIEAALSEPIPAVWPIEGRHPGSDWIHLTSSPSREVGLKMIDKLSQGSSAEYRLLDPQGKVVE